MVTEGSNRRAIGEAVECSMKNIEHLGGRTLTAEEIRWVQAETGLAVPAPLVLLLTSRPLVGLTLVLSEQADESRFGAELRWMTAEQMVDEATGAYPGIPAASRGFLPVGICLEGTGNPYFLRLGDGAIVRIPHDAATEDDLDGSQVDLVARSIEALVDAAEVLACNGA